MAKGEILACSKYYVEIDGLTDLIVKKVSGVATTLQTTGDAKSYGVTKGGKSVIQATVTGISNAKITVDFVATVQDKRLYQWFIDSHSQVSVGGGSKTKGERKTGSITLYNQGGEEAARWNLTGMMPSSYKSTKLEAGAEGLTTETVEFVYESLHRVK
ncbi:phage tail protein [Anabaena sp. FACHB-1237]|uniref:phage tail protein n=1 Tax=Anabaena sp. FACHB-1237 TaxID=2692769 RepID=UPI001680D21F|nr:phage tail protein [Anabaena sp. FACHB-1237]MBD2137991.1 phage tail protein [Anabaena sp. FACHB-1237]